MAQPRSQPKVLTWHDCRQHTNVRLEWRTEDLLVKQGPSLISPQLTSVAVLVFAVETGPVADQQWHYIYVTESCSDHQSRASFLLSSDRNGPTSKTKRWSRVRGERLDVRNDWLLQTESVAKISQLYSIRVCVVSVKPYSAAKWRAIHMIWKWDGKDLRSSLWSDQSCRRCPSRRLRCHLWAAKWALVYDLWRPPNEHWSSLAVDNQGQCSSVLLHRLTYFVFDVEVGPTWYQFVDNLQVVVDWGHVKANRI